MALTQQIIRLVPVPRNMGIQVPNEIPLGRWCDAVVLLTTVAQTYNLKLDANSVKGTLLRINSQAAIFVNALGNVAVAPAATTTDGSSAILMNSHLWPVMLQLPPGATSLSLVNVATGTNIVTIEAWN